MVRWRRVQQVEALLDDDQGTRIVVATGNSRWLAYLLLSDANEQGLRAASNLDVGDADLARGPLAELLSNTSVGKTSNQSLGVISLTLAFTANPVLSALGIGATAGGLIVEPAMRWLQDRGLDRAFVEAEQLMRNLPALRLVVLDLDAATDVDGEHLVELIGQRRAASADPLGVLVLSDEPVGTASEVGRGHPRALRRLAQWAGDGKAEWLCVAALEADEVESCVQCDPMCAQLLVELAGGDDLAAQRLWRTWQDQELVTRGRVRLSRRMRPWQATEALASLDRYYTRTLGDLDLPSEPGRELLGIAAQFGPRFCARSVIRSY